MVEINRLVELVYQEITHKLQQQNQTKKAVCIVSQFHDQEIEQLLQDTYEWVYFSEEIENKNFEMIIVPKLTVTMLANLANGLGTTQEEQFILNELLKGKKVIVFEEGVEYYSYKYSAPALLYKVYEDYEMKLKGYGIEFRHRYQSLMPPEKLEENSNSIPPAGNSETYTISKRVISESDLNKLYIQNIREIKVSKKCIITPLAKDFIRTHQLKIIESGS